MFWSLRFGDQLVNRLGPEDLPGQRARSCLQKNWCGAFQLQMRFQNAMQDHGFLRVRGAESTTALPTQQDRLPFALAACGLPDLGFVFATGACPRTLRRCLLPRCPLNLLALLFIGDALGICHGSCQSFYKCDFRNSEALQLGELLHQLLHAVLLKLYCNLRVIPIAFAPKHGSFPILRMPDPRPLLQSRLSRRSLYLQLGPRNLLPTRRKEARNIINRLPRS